MAEQVEVTTEVANKKPWQVLNDRDKGEIVAHFLHGLSPAQIATITKRSLPFVYDVLRSEDAQDTIQRFDTEREHGLMQVGERLQTSTVALVDQLLTIALTGTKEANRLNAVKHGLALAGMVPVQKIASVSAKVVISQDKITRAMETIAWEGSGAGHGHGTNGDAKGKLNESTLLAELTKSLTLDPASAGGVVVLDREPSRDASPGLAPAVPTEYVLPGEGGAWIRSADPISSPANLSDVAKQAAKAEANSAPEGTLQVYNGNQDIPGVVADQRSIDENPYYQCDRD